MFFGSRFSIVVESRHLDNDTGNSENVFNLSPQELQNRRIVNIDIGSDTVENQPSDREPSTYLSEKTGRGKLAPGWINQDKPMMCCYKLCTLKFQIFGLQGRIEENLFKVSLNWHLFQPAQSLSPTNNPLIIQIKNNLTTILIFN